MTKLKFNQRKCGIVEIKSNDPLEFKFNQTTCGRAQIKIHEAPQISNYNPNYRAEIKPNKPL
jgi:hypothetical protein